jgi:hypothetical protein
MPRWRPLIQQLLCEGGSHRHETTGPNQPNLVEVWAPGAVDPADRKEVDRSRFPSRGQAPIRASSIRPAHPMEVEEAEVRNQAPSA